MIRIIVVVLILLGGTARVGLAHKENEPPYIRVNNQDVGFNPAQTGLLQSFIIAEDVAVKPVLTNQTATFHVEPKNLIGLGGKSEDRMYRWEFGDNESAEGITVTHIYKKDGSYIVKLLTKNKTYDTGFSPLGSVLVHSVPSDSYTVPTVELSVNNQPLKNRNMELDFTQPIILEAKIEPTRSAGELQWDLGDAKDYREAKIVHQFDNKAEAETASVQFRDVNGFLAQASVRLINTASFTHKPVSQTRRPLFYAFSGLFILFLIGLQFLRQDTPPSKKESASKQKE